MPTLDFSDMDVDTSAGIDAPSRRSTGVIGSTMKSPSRGVPGLEMLASISGDMPTQHNPFSAPRRDCAMRDGYPSSLMTQRFFFAPAGGVRGTARGVGRKEEETLASSVEGMLAPSADAGLDDVSGCCNIAYNDLAACNTELMRCAWSHACLEYCRDVEYCRPSGPCDEDRIQCRR